MIWADSLRPCCRASIILTLWGRCELAFPVVGKWWFHRPKKPVIQLIWVYETSDPVIYVGKCWFGTGSVTYRSYRDLALSWKYLAVSSPPQFMAPHRLGLRGCTSPSSRRVNYIWCWRCVWSLESAFPGKIRTTDSAKVKVGSFMLSW